VRLKHPYASEKSLGTVWLHNRGLGTSAATFQFFEYKGRKIGHLLDPRTGWPASGTACASVTAATAAEADALSTAAFILGSTRTEELVRLKPSIGAVLLTDRARGIADQESVSDELIALNLAPETYSPPVENKS
jgi:thiamine biosynthesis lipoprotein